MNLRMNPNSLFAVLLRSSWWISAAIALALGSLAFALLPEAYRVVGAAGALPFLVISAIAGWKQARAPSSARVERTVEAARAMNWADFANAVEAGYRRDGWEVTRLDGGAADFAIARAGRTSLVGARRWKVGRTGVEPLRELVAARDAREAQGCTYLAVGEVTENARAFAAKNRIELVEGEALARLLPESGRSKTPPGAR
jgi:restriction system protein